MEVLFFRKSQPDPLIVGVSGIGHRYYGPKTDDRVRESNPGPTKKIVCKARGLNPGPTKKIDCTIVHAIVKYDRAYNHKN